MKFRMMKKMLGFFLAALLGTQPIMVAAPRKDRTESKASRVNTKFAGSTSGQPRVVQPAVIIPKSIPLTQPTQHQSEEKSDETRLARTTGGRKEERGSFAKKVDAYVAKIRSEYGHKDAHSKACADVLHKIKESDALKDVKKVIEPIKQLVDHWAKAGTKIQVQDQIGLALLLKSSLPLGEQARSIICEMLHKLDTYIAYWREQKHHPITYFFHKNPKKWFIGPKQKVEIEKNLKELVAVRDDHLRLLSRLAEQESHFDQSVSVSEQYEWLARYLGMISTICYNTQAKLEGISRDEENRFDKLLSLVNDMLGRVSFHEHNVSRVLGGAKKPGHVTRNWIAYSALAIGAGALTWYARRNQDKFYNWFNTDVKDGAVNFYTSVAHTAKDFYEAMIGKGEGGQGPEYYNQIQQDFDRQLDNAQRELYGLRDQLRATQEDMVDRVNQHYPADQEQNRQRDLYNASLNAVANYLEGRDVMVRNGALVQLPQADINFAHANNNNNNEQPENQAANCLRTIVHTTRIPEGVDLNQEQRAMLFRTALERALDNSPEDRRAQFLSTVVRESMTQAIIDIQRSTAALQNIQASRAWTKIGQATDAAGEIANRVPQLGAAIAMLGHVIAVGRVTVQDASNGLGDVGRNGANIVGHLAGFMNTLGGIVGQVPRVERNAAGQEVHVYQMNERGERVLDAQGQPIPVMVPGPLRAGMASGIDLAKKADQLLTQNKATFILAALIPAGVLIGGTTFGLSKLYKAFKYKPDFRPMREALIDIGHLLNEEGMFKNADEEQLDQGKILYLVWKLKREAENVPAVQRDQFIADVNRLGRSDLEQGKRVWTAEKKLRIIDLMYRTYDFLNPAYVAQ